MAWLFAIVVLILLVVSAGFRKFFGVLALLGALIGGIYFLYLKNLDRLATSRIPPSEVSVTNPKIRYKDGTYRFKGRVTNKSRRYLLSQVNFEISVKECPEQPSTAACIVIANTQESLHIQVPPGQARDFIEILSFPGEPLVPVTNHRWRFDIVGAKALPADA